MKLGGLSPLPCGLGGGTSGIQAHLDALLQQRGTGYDTTSPDQAPGACSPVWVEDMATARALEDLDGTNLRMSFVTDPQRTCFLSRWERIFGIVNVGAEENDRRRTLTLAWSRLGSTPTRQGIIDQLTAALGAVFVGYHNIPITQATLSLIPWTSTLAHVLVQTQTPAGWTEAQYQTAVAQIGSIMDWALPAWATWDVYRDGAGRQPPINHPPGGFLPDAQAGVYLDDPNLDNEVFDV